MPATYRSAGRTETGKVRRHNEDAILLRDDIGLWVVADGLGGHADGDYASALIVERLGALVRSGSVFDFVEAIEDALQQVNNDLREQAEQRRVDLIGSTVVVLVHDRDFMLCGWVGDSRAYCFEQGQLRQVTRDHVHGHRTEPHSTDPFTPPPAGSGVLTRAIGAQEHLFLDWAVTSYRPQMQFLLCSDGINKELSDDEIRRLCGRIVSPSSLLGRLFECALSKAARDNISAVIVHLP
ncbi:MAG: PP2C family serine/threonine-protein phosphatase [Dyella sp.]